MLDIYRRAVAAEPDDAEALSELGGQLKAIGKIDASIAAYEKAVRANPNHAKSHIDLGGMRLLAGRFADGWPEYEWRWRRPELPPLPPDFWALQWMGEDLGGQTLLLIGEQGLGDSIQFCRYIPLAAERANLIFAVQPQLIRLMAPFAGTAKLVALGQAIPPFQRICPLMSLPRVLGTELSNIPASVPYLRPERSALDGWGVRLPRHDGFSVGLVWAGNPEHHDDQNRSIPFLAFAPLFDSPGVRWFSLQLGPKRISLQDQTFGVADLTPHLVDFAETAAAICHLDLVITVDTAVAHLAGALGRPTWLLLPFSPDWRWLLDRADSPWYPTMRLFRQPDPGNWPSVIAMVREQLCQAAENRSAGIVERCPPRPIIS